MRDFVIKLKIRLILAILLIAIPGSLTQAFGLEISVNEQASVRGDVICLGDVASFDPMDDARVSQLKRIEISYAPPPGTDSTINKDLLTYRITPFLSDYNDVVIKVPDYILVRRKAQTISAARLEEIFTEHIVKSSPWPEENLIFEKINTPGQIALPEGKLQWEIQENHNRDYLGNVALTLNFRIDDKPFRKISLSGRISLEQEVVKAAKRIGRGQVISEEDLILVTENIQKYRSGTISNISDVLGKQSLRTIQADQTILSSMIEVPPMVKKGNHVLIKVENEEIRITTTGKVLEDGRSGDRIKVMNINSGKELFAVVKGPDLVEVYF